ncbi:MAG: hypothetical protein OSJ70_04720 [Bacilli bacterium]|nr:hypothetical protein [Bacilli bacterium]
MNRFDECYKSLTTAQKNLVTLEDKIKKNSQMIKDSLLYDIPERLNMPIADLANVYDERYRQKRNFSLKLFGIGYVSIIVIFAIIAIITKSNIAPALSSILTVFTCFNISGFSKVKKLRGSKKFIDEVLEIKKDCNNDDAISLRETIEFLEEYNEQLFSEIDDRKTAIAEYEQMLDAAQSSLANEIISKHGINAEIELNASIKKKKPKSLTKIYVNK